MQQSLRIELICLTLAAGFFVLGLASFEYKVPDIIINKPPLETVEVALDNLASNKLYDMITNKKFDHTDYNGCDFNCRVARDKVLDNSGAIWAAENLYVYPSCDIRDAIEKWTTSPLHLANLNHNYNYGNIQIYRLNADRCYIIFDIAE